MRPRTRFFLLWTPPIILIITAFVVFFTILTSNSHRLDRLEDSQNPTVITFTFNQPTGRFRILCNADTSVPNIYICTTTRVGPPSPTPSSGGG